MAETVALVAQPRNENGSQAARKLRRKGLVPAVLYGHKEAAIHLSLDLDDDQGTAAWRLASSIKQKAARKKKPSSAICSGITWAGVLHRFHACVARRAIHVTVRLELRGVAPGVNAGGVLDQPLHELEIECLAISIPESIRVNIAELQIGGVIHVKDLTLPEGITTKADPDAIVVHVTTPAAEPEPGAIPEGTGTAEPEVIGKAKEEEESES